MSIETIARMLLGIADDEATTASITSRESDRQALARAVDEYLAAGGRIYQCAHGETAVDHGFKHKYQAEAVAAYNRRAAADRINGFNARRTQIAANVAATLDAGTSWSFFAMAKANGTSVPKIVMVVEHDLADHPKAQRALEEFRVRSERRKGARA